MFSTFNTVQEFFLLQRQISSIIKFDKHEAQDKISLDTVILKIKNDDAVWMWRSLPRSRPISFLW